MTATRSEPKPTAAPIAAGAERLIVHQHSDLIYWWVVWAYGLFCGLWTWLRGSYVTVSPGHKPVLIYPHAWVGISFVTLVLFVLVFTNARARGVKSLVLFLVLAVLGLLIELAWGWDEILRYIPLLLVHMNLAFYVLFSSILLAAWVFIILGTDHASYWEFAPGSIAKKYWFTDAGESFSSPLVETARQS